MGQECITPFQLGGTCIWNADFYGRRWDYVGTAGGMDPKSDKFRQSELPNLDDFKDEFDQYETPVEQRKHRLYVVTCTNCKRKILCGSCICWVGCLGKGYGV